MRGISGVETCEKRSMWNLVRDTEEFVAQITFGVRIARCFIDGCDKYIRHFWHAADFLSRCALESFCV